MLFVVAFCTVCFVVESSDLPAVDLRIGMMFFMKFELRFRSSPAVAEEAVVDLLEPVAVEALVGRGDVTVGNVLADETRVGRGLVVWSPSPFGFDSRVIKRLTLLSGLAMSLALYD